MKTRSLLLCGALAVATTLCGCATVIETSKNMVNKLTGADDPKNTGLLAKAGRLQNAGTDAVAGAVGIKTEPVATTPETMVTPSTPAEQPAVAPSPAPEPVVAPTPTSKSASVKKVAKSSSVKPVATTMPRKQ